jgi:predicted ATP-dependent protease
VLIPRTNVQDLMLRSEVQVAVRDDRFRVYLIETIDQGMEQLGGRGHAPDTAGHRGPE